MFKENFDLIKKILKFMAPYKRKFIVGSILIIFSNIFNIVSFIFFGNIIDAITKKEIANLTTLISLFIALNVLASTNNFFGTLKIAKITQKIMYNIRKELFFKTQTAHISYFNNNSSGEILSIYANDLELISFIIDQSFRKIVINTLVITVTLIALIYLNIYLAIFNILTLFIYILVSKILGKKIKKASKETQKRYGELSGFAQESINGLKTIKIYNTKQSRIDSFKNLTHNCAVAQAKTNVLSFLTVPLSTIISNLIFVFYALIGIWLILKGQATLGTIIIYFKIAQNLTAPSREVTNHIASVVKALPAAKRIFNLIEYNSEVYSGKYIIKNIDNKTYITTKNSKVNVKNKDKNDYIDLKPFKADIEFKNVSFNYSDNVKNDLNVLNNISFKVNSGQTIAIVGKTGVGKSTIFNLLNRFYELEHNNGEILLNGINIQDIYKRDLRKCISIILQDSKLFSGSILDNISYGKSNATRNEIIEAAKKANAHQFISKLKNGYDTIIDNKNTTLSHGQIQLISIARAILADTDILLLDEATSSVDTKTEKIIQEAIKNISKYKTTIIIAHRLSTIQNADCIYLLADGKILEHGTHDELIQQKGEYYTMYTN